MEGRHHRPPRPHQGAVDRVRNGKFPMALRGYDRAAVDPPPAEIAQPAAELEATQLRENVVQRALDEVGEQTSSILQHAHETAEEITASSRSQAEGRIQRAEREAEHVRREAAQYADRVAADTRRLTEERMRLIEELRMYAEAVLAVADDALERLPELLAGSPDATTQQLPETIAQLAPADLDPAPEPAPEPAPAPEPGPDPIATPAPDPVTAAEPPAEVRYDDGVSEG